MRAANKTFVADRSTDTRREGGGREPSERPVRTTSAAPTYGCPYRRAPRMYGHQYMAPTRVYVAHEDQHLPLTTSRREHIGT